MRGAGAGRVPGEPPVATFVFVRSGTGRRPVAGRNGLHDLVAVRLQLLQQHGQREHRRRMDVVQQEDAAMVFRFDALHRKRHDLFRGDAVMPVVRDFVRAPYGQRFVGEIRIRLIAAQKPWNSEERRDRARVADRGIDRFNAAVDFLRQRGLSHPVERQGVMQAVRSDDMT